MKIQAAGLHVSERVNDWGDPDEDEDDWASTRRPGCAIEERKCEEASGT